MIAGISVQMTSRRVLPWIGGPSSSSWPGRCRNFHTQYSVTPVTRTKNGTDAMSRTSHSVSIGSACVEAGVGNQSMSSPRMIPRIDATTPSRMSCTAEPRPRWR
jgi:hypothetical protein